MTSPTFARGARVLITEGEGAPPDMVGKTCLVLAPEHEEQPGSAVVSLDVMPMLIALVPRERLAPTDERACVAADPSCTLLEPCGACLHLLRTHLSQALARAGIAGSQGVAFIAAWNELRGKAREGVKETIAQARAWAARTQEYASTTPLAPPEETSPQAQAVENAKVSPAREQVIPKGGEKKASTRRRTSRTKAASSAAEAGAEALPSDADEGTSRADEAAGSAEG